MRFLSFSAENFITFPQIQLDFQSASSKGLTLVDGWNHDQGQANGAGKSVLFNSIAFAVYGKTATDVNLQDLVSEWGGTLKTDVQLEVPVGVIRITRTRKPNVVRLFVGDSEFKGTSDAIEKRILDVVGLSFEQFLQVAYFYQGARDRFVDVNDTAKKSFLASVLGLDKCEIAYSRAHEALKAREGQVFKLEGIVATLLGIVQNIERSKTSALQQLSDFRSSKEQAVIEIRTRYSANSKETQLKAALDKAFVEEQEAIRAIGSADALLEERSGIVKEAELSRKAGMLLARTRAEHESAQHEARRIGREIQRLTDSLAPGQSARCTSCGQLLPEDGLKHVQVEVDAMSQTLVIAQTKVAELQRKMEKTELLLRKTESADRRLQEIDQQIRKREAASHLADLKKQAVLTAQQTYKTYQETTAAREESMHRELAALDKREQMFLQAASESGAALATNQEKLNSEHTNLNKVKEEVAYLQETKRIYSPTGLRAHVVDGVVSELNERIDHYLTELFSGQMRFHYDLDDSGKLVGKLFFAGRDRSSLATLSGGQRQRVRLAVDLALSDVVSNRLSVRPNLMFLDEVTDGLDSIGREGLMLLLSELERTRDVIYVADHESEMKSRFSRSIWLELRGGQTSMSRGV